MDHKEIHINNPYESGLYGIHNTNLSIPMKSNSS